MPRPVSDLTANYRRHKATVTRLRNKSDWQGVIHACDIALGSFDAYGWPDNWAHFERERRDAVEKLWQDATYDAFGW